VSGYRSVLCKIRAKLYCVTAAIFLLVVSCFAAGEAQWKLNGVEVSTAPTNQQEMEIIKEAGGAIMVWWTNNGVQSESFAYLSGGGKCFTK